MDDNSNSNRRIILFDELYGEDALAPLERSNPIDIVEEDDERPLKSTLRGDKEDEDDSENQRED